MRNLLCSLLFSALALSAAELTGNWSGSFDFTTPDGENRSDSAYMSLKQNGDEVTGTAGPNADKQWAVQKGKLVGQKLTFEVRTEDGDLLLFDLTFDGATIQGDVKGTSSEGEHRSAKVNLKRAT